MTTRRHISRLHTGVLYTQPEKPRKIYAAFVFRAPTIATFFAIARSFSSWFFLSFTIRIPLLSPVISNSTGKGRYSQGQYTFCSVYIGVASNICAANVAALGEGGRLPSSPSSASTGLTESSYKPARPPRSEHQSERCWRPTCAKKSLDVTFIVSFSVHVLLSWNSALHWLQNV